MGPQSSQLQAGGSPRSRPTHTTGSVISPDCSDPWRPPWRSSPSLPASVPVTSSARGPDASGTSRSGVPGSTPRTTPACRGSRAWRRPAPTTRCPRSAPRWGTTRPADHGPGSLRLFGGNDVGQLLPRRLTRLRVTALCVVVEYEGPFPRRLPRDPPCDQQHTSPAGQRRARAGDDGVVHPPTDDGRQLPRVGERVAPDRLAGLDAGLHLRERGYVQRAAVGRGRPPRRSDLVPRQQVHTAPLPLGADPPQPAGGGDQPALVAGQRCPGEHPLVGVAGAGHGRSHGLRRPGEAPPDLVEEAHGVSSLALVDAFRRAAALLRELASSLTGSARPSPAPAASGPAAPGRPAGRRPSCTRPATPRDSSAAACPSASRPAGPWPSPAAAPGWRSRTRCRTRR